MDKIEQKSYIENRKNNFDFLRFIFAFIVVLGHLVIISGVKDFQKILPYLSSYTSVTAFFIISGFLISSSYLKSNSIKLYLKKRAKRLLPAYFFVIIFSAIFLSFFSSLSFIEYFTNFHLYKYLIANLSFLNFISPCLPGVFLDNNITCDVNGALWTLKIEVGFYLLIPILITFIEKVNKKYFLFILIYLLSVVYKLSLESIAEYYNLNTLRVLSRQLPGFLSYFISGICCYYYSDSFIKYKIKLLFLGLFLFILERFLGWEILTPFALSLIIFGLAFTFKKLNNFARYGDISYGIYIFHFPIIKIATEMGAFENTNPFLAAISLIIIIIGFGFISWHMLEKRFLNKATFKKQ